MGKIDHGAVWMGYLGLLFMSATYISIGLFASSITSNQIVAFLLALFIGIFFHLIFGLIGGDSRGWLGSILRYLSLSTHYESMARGVLDSKDVVYFLSIIFAALAGTELTISKRNVSN